MIQWYAVTSATSGFTTVTAAYQTTCTQYYRIATVCGSVPLVDYRIFPINFLTTHTMLRCENIFDVLMYCLTRDLCESTYLQPILVLHCRRQQLLFAQITATVVQRQQLSYCL